MGIAAGRYLTILHCHYVKESQRSHLLARLLLEKWKIAGIGEDVEKREPWCVAGGHGEWSTVENSLAVPQKAKHGMII